jgi:hypothetical protein
MRPFACGTCGSLVFFENFRCLTCDSELGFDRACAELVVRPDDHPRCANHDLADCNWLAEPTGPLCGSCALTRTRPADGDTAALAAFAATEAAKRRLVFQLDHLHLSTDGLAFDLLSSQVEPVTTGHADGVVTIDLAEGSDPHREAMRVQLAEPYRTLLGHLRHEVGHYYWTVLVEAGGRLETFRELFGDERADYGEALEKHYATADDRSWTETHISNYAAAHPWEDWAETFAHYLHIRDTMQTAHAWGIHTSGPDIDLDVAWNARLAVDPIDTVTSFDEMTRAWIAFTFAMNAVNDSMGLGPLYPFALNDTVQQKLRFVHDAVGCRT